MAVCSKTETDQILVCSSDIECFSILIIGLKFVVFFLFVFRTVEEKCVN